ncbi:hypothetical protein TNCV_4660831 [Trichonephila clavipes]|uniref:Uncharacterized protein n=1 Tax=Trichonephila clavipes TaxID=2585209 RepID=A0A8X6S9B6_TRICX|nr:hypothetical protein TNCV_4660831 [Trichonephila clavipes]
MDLVILNHGQVTRTTPELGSHSSKIPHYANGKILSPNRFNMRQLLCMPRGYGHELVAYVSRVQSLAPPKTHRIEKPMPLNLSRVEVLR